MLICPFPKTLLSHVMTTVIQSYIFVFIICRSDVIENKHPMAVLKTRAFWTLWFMFLTNGQAVQFGATLYKVSTLGKV